MGARVNAARDRDSGIAAGSDAAAELGTNSRPGAGTVTSCAWPLERNSVRGARSRIPFEAWVTVADRSSGAPTTVVNGLRWLVEDGDGRRARARDGTCCGRNRVASGAGSGGCHGRVWA